MAVSYNAGNCTEVNGDWKLERLETVIRGGELMACVRVAIGVPTKTHPEHHQIGVEQFLEMLRFDQRSKLDELPGIRK